MAVDNEWLHQGRWRWQWRHDNVDDGHDDNAADAADDDDDGNTKNGLCNGLRYKNMESYTVWWWRENLQ